MIRRFEKRSGEKAMAIVAPLAIFLFAFGLRFLYIYGGRGDITSECLVLDPRYYSNWGLRIAGGDLLGGTDVFEMTPLYAYFLGAVYGFLTTDLFFVRLIQIFIGSASCVLVYKIASGLLESRRAGLIAGLASAAYAPFIFYDGMIMKPVLEVFFVLLMTWLLISHLRRPFAFPFLAGCSLALAALLRENIILLIPVIPLWLLLASERRTYERLLSALAFLFGVFLLILPVTARNYYVSGELVLITSGGGEVFYIGNNPESDGTYIPPKFVRPTPELEHEDFRRRARELTGRDLTRKEASDFWYNEGMRFIKEDPVRFLRLLSRKLIIFWNFYELPDNQNYYFQRTVSGVLGAPLPHFGIVAPFGLLGMLLALREARRYSILYLAFLTYMASVLVFFNFARFRILAVPFLIIFGAYALAWGAEKIRERGSGRLAVALAMLAAFFAVSNYNVLGKDPYRYKFDTAWTNLGNCEAENGRLQEAFGYFRKALEINPRYPTALVGVGNILTQTGDLLTAEKAFRAAIAENPVAAPAYSGLGAILSARGEAAPALEALSKAVDLDPENPAYLTNLGYALSSAGRLAEAIEAFRKALNADPAFADAYWGLASASESSGQYDDAASYWEKFIRISPREDWKAKARERLDRLRPLINSSP